MFSLRDLLEMGNLSITLCGELKDPDFDFDWYDMKLSDEGMERYKDILNLPVKQLSTDVYRVYTNENPALEDVLDEFIRYVAGYCQNETWETYFIET